ncbi:dna-directed rna polymerase ii 19 kda polypeptide [Nannochloropsis gaditana]|uniref:Dna-directed rna polymerase ii 19 kDa polypeptide n=2 Tax=Nannochloropsis gaditana TaxID=72520 RepID=W7TB21_9STRA|nr:dna-directed rna polymerase ii 19 kda polypeptide [Nannochloropsis gaditana]
MFYLKTLEKDFMLEPKDLGPGLKETIKRRLTQMMEGTLEPDLGFVIALVALDDQHIRPGKIEYETGEVEVWVKFTVMLFRPFRNEILDAQVTTVTDMGFFADAGPVQGIYVNKHQMPQDYGFDAQDNVWRTSDMEVEIRPGCGVRMRVVGVDITPGRMNVVGSIMDDYTGLISGETD